MGDEFVPLGTAAKTLGVTKDAIRRCIDVGDLPAYRDPLDGRRLLLRRDDLDQIRRPKPIVRRRTRVPAVAS